jgi:hypothetical protein
MQEVCGLRLVGVTVPRPGVRCGEGGGDVGDLLDQPQGVRDASEAVVLVEGGGVVVEGVDDDEAGSDDAGGLHDPPQRLDEDGAPDTLALHTAVQGHAREEHCRDLAGAAATDLGA